MSSDINNCNSPPNQNFDQRGARYIQDYRESAIPRCSYENKDSVTALHKSPLIYQFICKCDVCHIGLTSQRSAIRINKHIPSSIRTHTSNYTAASSQNSTSAIGRHLLANQACACVYSPTIFTILDISTNELQLSIPEALLIKKYKPELCIQKQFYSLLLFNNLFGPSEETIITRNNSIGLR